MLRKTGITALQFSQTGVRGPPAPARPRRRGAGAGAPPPSPAAPRPAPAGGPVARSANPHAKLQQKRRQMQRPARPCGSPEPPNFVSAPVFTFALSTAADTAHDGGRPRRWVPSFSFFFCLFLSRTWPTWSFSMSTWIFCAGESRYLPAGPWAAPAGLARRARPQKAGGNSRTQAYGATWDSGLSQSCGGWIKKSAAVGRGGRFGGRRRATPAGGVDQLG